MKFEVFCKMGRHWVPKGEFNATDSKAAARKCQLVHGRKIFGVRPAGTNAKLFIHKL